ncbi:MAG: delta-60 repeat domain-containing protein [Chloroflexota bacterium]
MTCQALRLVAAGLAALVLWSGATLLHAHDSGMGLVRYNPDGSLDAGFGGGGVVAERTVQGGLSPEAAVIQTDGKIVLAGTTSDLATAGVGFGLVRYNSDGTLDSRFGTGGRVLTRIGVATAEAHALALQSDGCLLVAGSGFVGPSTTSNFGLARYTQDGSLDQAFGSGGGAVLTAVAGGGAEARAIALQPDGRIVLAGTTFGSGTTNDALALVRYNADGSLDSNFGSGGSVTTAFDIGGTAAGSGPFRAAAVLIQPDGKLVAVGTLGGHLGAFALARYLGTGDLDPVFGVGGRVITQREANTQAYAAALQPDGMIVVAGGVGTGTDSVAFALSRYAANGDLDRRFGSGGLVATPFDGGGSGAHAVTVEADGKIVAIGAGYAPAAPAPLASSPQGAVNGGFAAARYLPNGAIDTSFGKDGFALTTVGDAGSLPSALASQPDGKLVASGVTYFLVPGPTTDNRLTINPLFVAVLAGLVILAGAVLVRWRRSHRLRSAGSQTGPAPGA